MALSLLPTGPPPMGPPMGPPSSAVATANPGWALAGFGWASAFGWLLAGLLLGFRFDFRWISGGFRLLAFIY